MISDRAYERQILQKRFKSATLYRLEIAVESGAASLADIRKYYTDARAIAQKRIARINKSDVGFIDAPPVFEKTSEISDSDLLKAVSDINRFLKGQSDYGVTTVKERRIALDKSISSLKKHGIDFVDVSNYSDWARFQKWFRSSIYAVIYDSDSDTTTSIFQQSLEMKRADSKSWSGLFKRITKR